MESKVNQAKEDAEVAPPQHTHRKKLAAEAEARAHSNPVVEEWLDIVSDHQNRKGGKVRHCTRTKNKNIHRQYMGRHKDLKEFLEVWQKSGKKILR